MTFFVCYCLCLALDSCTLDLKLKNDYVPTFRFKVVTFSSNLKSIEIFASEEQSTVWAKNSMHSLYAYDHYLAELSGNCGIGRATCLHF